MSTPNLSLVPLAAAQSQKHVTVNEAFARIDAATQLAVLDRTRTTPPETPNDGDRHLVASPATGDWLSHEDDIASWDAASQGWLFLSPRDGWRVRVIEDRVTLDFDGETWSPSRPMQLGVNASADDTNRLTVASEAVLLTHDGAGIQAKLNKAADTDTASVLFQSGYTGHAEIGLTGGTDLQFKTSPDGATFTEAMTFDGATGHANLPAGATISGVTVHPDMALNVLPDQGRFGGEDISAVIRAPSFIQPGYLGGYNGSTISGYAPFIHNNTTYGGVSGDLDPEIDALLALTRPATDRRWGIEWWATKIAKGPGTNIASTVDGVPHHLAMRTFFAPMPRAFTMGVFLRTLSGSAFIDQRETSRFRRWETDETGNDAAGVVTPTDGWVFIERQMTFGLGGFNSQALHVHLAGTDAEVLMALPRLVTGHVHLDPYLPGPLPNNRFFG